MPGTALWVDGFICLPLSPFICLPLSPSLDAWHWVDGFICLPLSQPGCLLWMDGFICLPLSSLDAWHGSLDGRVHLSPFVSLPLSSVVSQPGCLARLSGWTGLFVSLYLPSFVSRCLPALSQPGCLARLSGWTGSFVSLCLAWMPGTALWVDGFICLPLSPFICLPLSPSLDAWHWVDGFICLPLSQPGCLAQLSGWTGLFVSLCLPFVSRCFPAWMPGTGWTGSFVSLCPSLDAWHGSLVDDLSPFVSLHLSPVVSQPSLDAWHGSLGGRVHLSPFVSLHVFFSVCLPFSGCVCLPVSRPGCLAQLSKRSQPGCLAFICVPSFASMLVVAWHGFWVAGSFSLCLPSFVSCCLRAWMPGTAL